MGYFLTTQPENAVPPKSWIPPKTHTPGSRVEKRGQRFDSPEMGRGVNRSMFNDSMSNPYACSNVALKSGVTQAETRNGDVPVDKSYNMPGGEAGCNPKTGEVDITIDDETCAGDCAWKHEVTHRGQQQPCCQKLTAACKANPQQCNSYILKYNEWHMKNAAKFECAAMIAQAACYLGALSSGDAKKKSCSCYDEMNGQVDAVWQMKDKACAAAGNPFDITPCPDF